VAFGNVVNCQTCNSRGSNSIWHVPAYALMVWRPINILEVGKLDEKLDKGEWNEVVKEVREPKRVPLHDVSDKLSNAEFRLNRWSLAGGEDFFIAVKTSRMPLGMWKSTLRQYFTLV